MATSRVFSKRFLDALRSLVVQHHTIYPRLPPQGIYFESLVERAFRLIRQPFSRIEPSNPNSPKHDLMVRNARISIKTETGAGTRRDSISITKLCTTERDPWAPDELKKHVLRHLSGYDHILMLRAVWEPPVVHYQVLSVPVGLLRLIVEAELIPVGKRTGRRSLGADVHHEGRKVFHVHFDGADGKCQVLRLPVAECQMLARWDYQIHD